MRWTRPLRPFLAIPSLLGLLSVGTAAQCLRTEDQQLGFVTGGRNEYAGLRLALDGDRLAWSAPGRQGGSISTYVWAGSHWQVQQRFRGGSRNGSVRAGDSLALDGDRLMVGDPGVNQNKGRITCFEYDGSAWQRGQELAPPDLVEDDRFCEHLALDGDWLFASSIRPQDEGHATGAVWAFHHDGTQWVDAGRLVPSGSSAFEYYGSSLSLQGERLVVGARNSRVDPGSFGRVYVFEYDGSSWVETQVLKDSDPDSNGIGGAVAQDGPLLVALTNGGLASVGAVEIFRHDGVEFVHEQRLEPRSQDILVTFGEELALSDDTILVGGHRFDEYEGAAYVFRHNGLRWIEVEQLAIAEPAGGPQLGHAVALFGDRVVVGAPLADVDDVNSGAVYAYSLQGLGIGASDRRPSRGDLVSLECCGGVQTGLQYFAVIGIDGQPTFKKLNLGVFDAEGRVSNQYLVSPGLTGATFNLQAYGFVRPGVIGTSGRISLELQ